MYVTVCHTHTEFGMRLGSVLAFVTVATAFSVDQQFLGVLANTSRPTHLSVVSSDAFTTLTHPKFPKHGIRIRKSSFCDPTVKYTTQSICIQPMLMCLQVFGLATWTRARSISFSTFSKADGIRTRVCPSCPSICATLDASR